MITTNEFCKKEYREKLYKISLDAGFNCPNRDGKVGTGGCIFCSNSGSGDFTEQLKSNADSLDKIKNERVLVSRSDIDEIIENAKKRVANKFKGNHYIAYFQAYTNTYAEVEKLRELYFPIIKRDDIKVLSVATRPDCLGDDVIKLLKELNDIKPVWVELGLQTTKPESVKYINRCYGNCVYYEAMKKLNRIGIHTITHVIVGLPDENKEDIMQTVKDVIKAGSKGIKIQLLHVLKGTRLEQDFVAKKFKTLKLEEYLSILKDVLKILPSDMVVHRLTGDGPKKLLIEPKWSADKKMVLNKINEIIKEI